MDDETVPRPECGCGGGATHEVVLTVRKLVLERDSGVRSQPYWSPSFKTTGVEVKVLMCNECVRRHVSVGITIAANLEVPKASP